MTDTDKSTFVGDLFTVTYPKFDKEPFAVYNGYQAKLLGFKKTLKPVLPYDARVMGFRPGFYMTLGDPLVRLENSKVIQIPLAHLAPQETSQELLLLKSASYNQELQRMQYVESLPYLKCHPGDQALVARHGRLAEDIVGYVTDVSFQGRRPFFLIETEGKSLEVHEGVIIDVIELGDYSENERYLAQSVALGRMLGRKGLDLKYQDYEHNLKEG